MLCHGYPALLPAALCEDILGILQRFNAVQFVSSTSDQQKQQTRAANGPASAGIRGFLGIRFCDFICLSAYWQFIISMQMVFAGAD